PGAEIHYTLDGTDPSPISPFYTGPFVVLECVRVRARGFKSGLRPSPIAKADFTIDTGPGEGDGLIGTLYDNQDFTGTTVTRLDPTIDFDWGYGSPAPGIQPTYWSARWVGKVQPRCFGIYTFYVTPDDGARLWVNNRRLINQWNISLPVEYSNTIVLQ